MESESAAGASRPPTPTHGSGRHSCEAAMKSKSVFNSEMSTSEKELEDPLQTFLLHTVLGYGNTFQLGCFYAKPQTFASVTIYSLVTEEKKDFGSVTVAFVEEMNRFYGQKMYVNSPPWPQSVLTNL